MKKSKIIVPALGIIALSTAASITGTVAWFTATRTAKLTAGNFAVTKTSNNLEVVLSAGAGTSVDAETKKIVTVDGVKLTDASFDHVNKNVYAPDEDGAKIVKEFALSAVGTGDNNVRATNVVSVVTWDMAVTVAFGSVDGDMGLYLKTYTTGEDEVSTVTLSEGSAALTTAKGFRMAFVPKASGDVDKGAVTRVWAANQTSANCKYVTHLTTADATSPDGKAIDGKAYTSPYLLSSGYNTVLPASGESGITAADAALRPDFLGKFTYAENTKVTINYTVVCWYEGTDPEIYNREVAADYQTVKSSIILEAIKLKKTV